MSLPLIASLIGNRSEAGQRRGVRAHIRTITDVGFGEEQFSEAERAYRFGWNVSYLAQIPKEQRRN